MPKIIKNSPSITTEQKEGIIMLPREKLLFKGSEVTFLVERQKEIGELVMKSDSDNMSAIREIIAKEVELQLDEIDPVLYIQGRGEGQLHAIAKTIFMFDSYKVGYKYTKLKDEPSSDQENSDSDLELAEQAINVVMESV